MTCFYFYDIILSYERQAVETESKHLFDRRFEIGFVTRSEKYAYISPYSFDGEPGIQVKFCGTLSADPQYIGSRHKQLAAFPYIYVLEHITKGRGVIETEDAEYFVSEGDTVLIRRRTECVYYADEHDPYEKIWFNMSGPILNGYTQLFGLTDPVTVVKADTRDKFHMMIDIISQMDNSNKRHVYAEFLKVLLEILEIMSSSRDKLSEHNNPLPYKVKKLIDSTPYYQIRLSEIAEQLFYTPRHLNRVFSFEFGMLPEEYILRQKMDLAKILLLNTNESTKSISEKLGYCDVHYFMRVFKRINRESVGAYRRRTKEMNANEH